MSCAESSVVSRNELFARGARGKAHRATEYRSHAEMCRQPAGPRGRLKRSHVDAEVSGQSSQWEEFALRRTHGEGLADAAEDM